ncbi:DUF2029 domain-containing protein [Geomonas oryzisoli]|uniref:DUF2029 domain-containing protein n=1 Tax=Geomonas oryzisoli TaxID=2847992 RepID=A0ABX8J858_9BACT|nr:DUF2029 domain-containing protein [Geomonas oryzisoli]QWV92892.1 DUF2029 domain-containing protein [Geomonas oryzisoli]
MSEHLFRRPLFLDRWLTHWIFIAIILVCGIYSAWDKYETSIAIDFYQMWGIGNAMKASDHSLPTPYFAKSQYGKILDAISEATPDERLQVANKTNHQIYDFGLEPTASPLLFALFALFPRGYSQSYGIFLACDLSLFAFSIVLLFKRFSSLSTFLVLLFGIILFEPFRSDLNLGNLNLFQFSAVSIGLYYSEKVRSHDASFASRGIFLALIAFGTLIKPNLALIAIAFAAPLLLPIRREEIIRLLATLVTSVFLLLAIPCIYFKSFTVWSHWLQYLTTAGKLNFGLFSGNLSTTAVIAFVSGQPSDSLKIVILVLSAIFGTVAMFCSTPRSLRCLLGCSDSSIAIAMIVTLAISPLVWWHYYLILLVPIIWLVNVGPMFSVPSALGVLSLLLASNIISLFDRNLYLYNVYIVPSCWIPLLVGVLLACRAQLDVHNPSSRQHEMLRSNS